MNVVDSSAWLEYFADGPNATRFAAPIEDTHKLVVPTICILEVFKRVLQQRDERVALDVVAVMRQGASVDRTPEIALQAARVGVTYKLPLADSVVFATAQTCSATLWTQDADFEGIDGVKFFPKKK